MKDRLHASNSIPLGNAYNKYATTNRVERVLMDGFLRTLTEVLPQTDPATILEVGVGEGELAGGLVRQRYPRSRVVGLDLPDASFVALWRDLTIEGVFGDIHRLPFPDDSMDLVLAIEVLEHVHDPSAALDEIARVSRGLIVASVPREPIWRIGNMLRRRYVQKWGNTPGHVQHWSTAAFVSLLRDHLDVVEVHKPLPWTMVLARSTR